MCQSHRCRRRGLMCCCGDNGVHLDGVSFSSLAPDTGRPFYTPGVSPLASSRKGEGTCHSGGTSSRVGEHDSSFTSFSFFDRRKKQRPCGGSISREDIGADGFRSAIDQAYYVLRKFSPISSVFGKEIECFSYQRLEVPYLPISFSYVQRG